METMSAATSREMTEIVPTGEEAEAKNQPHPLRACGCGRREGDLVEMAGEKVPLVVNRGDVGFDPRDGEPIVDYVCRICHRNGVKCAKLKFVYAEVARLHKQWEERQETKQTARDAAKARREAKQTEERQAIEAELMAVINGTAKAPLVSCEEKDGIWRCIRPNCSCQKALQGKPKPIRTLAVIGDEIRRVCCVVAGVIHDLQSRGMREVGVWGFALSGDLNPGKRSFEEAEAKCKGHRNWLRGQARDKQAKAEHEAPVRPQFIPGPRVTVDPGGIKDTEASLKAKARQAAYLEALQRGEGLEAVCPVRERSGETDETWSVVLRHNQAMDAMSAAKRSKKNQGGKNKGGKDKGKGGRKQ